MNPPISTLPPQRNENERKQPLSFAQWQRTYSDVTLRTCTRVTGEEHNEFIGQLITEDIIHLCHFRFDYESLYEVVSVRKSVLRY